MVGCDDSDIATINSLASLHLIIYLLFLFVVPVKLREYLPHIVNHNLGQLSRGIFSNKTEEFTKSVVDDIANLFLERERCELLPFEFLVIILIGFHEIHFVLDLVNFFGHFCRSTLDHGDILWSVDYFSLRDTAHHKNVVFAETKCEHIGHLNRHFDLENTPDLQLGIISFYGICKLILFDI